MKYITINGKIRHAHAPVGPTIDYEGESGHEAMLCRGCGYHVCSCPPADLWDIVFYEGATVHKRVENGYLLVVQELDNNAGFWYGANPVDGGAFELTPLPYAVGLSKAKEFARNAADFKRHLAEHVQAYLAHPPDSMLR